MFNRSAKSTARPSLIERLMSLAGSSAAPEPANFQPLEARQMLAATVIDDFDDITVSTNSPGTVIALAPRITDPALNGNIIKFASNMGDLYVQLYNETTPLTVANFMQYVNSAAGNGFSYNDTIIHRRATNFVIQGGGYRYVGGETVVTSISQFPPVANEFHPGTNLRGTISMAKLGDNPNSATNQWFFNLADNTSTLDTQNGGFTAFGRVLGSGMTIVDAMAAVPIFNAGSPFDTLPLRNYTDGAPYLRENFVIFNTITLTSRMTYSVSVGDPTKVSAQIIDGNLSLSYLANATGTTTVTVTGTSRDGGDPISDTFTVSIGTPSIVATEASTAMVQPGTSFTMSSTGVADQGGTVAAIQYWRDANANGTFEAASDTLITTVTSSENNWRGTITTGGTPSGLQTYFARPQDNESIFGAAVSTQVRVNANPTLGGVTSSATNVLLGQAVDLSTTDAADSDDTVDRVRYYRDTNGNGTLEVGVDAELSASTSNTTNFRSRISTTGFGTGTVTLFAQAEDEFDGLSNVVSTTINILQNPPTLTSLRITPALLANAGTPFVLTAAGFRDVDGTVAAIQYWRDADGNGFFNADEDSLLGESTTASGGYRFEVNTTGFDPGTYTFFGRARDNTDLLSAAVAVTARINAAPTIAALTPSAESVERLSFFVLTASGVADDTTIKSVSFYRDIDGNGEYSTADRLVGKGKRNPDGTWSFRASTAGFATGVNTFFAVATDANGGLSGAATTTTTIVNALPTAAGITAKPLVIANLGDNVTLTIKTPKDRDGTIQRVQYFLDVDNDGIIDTTGETPDLFLGESFNRGYALTVATGSFIVGNNTVLAQVIDNDGDVSAPSSVVVRVNAVPTIAALTSAEASVERLAFATLTASGVADDTVVSSVAFFRDVDGDGAFNAAVDRTIGKGKRNPDGTWSLRVSTKGFATGLNTFFAVATDSNKGTSAAAIGTFTVVNALPTAAGITAKPALIANLGDNLTLTIKTPKDRDGTVSLVRYFLDTNGNGTIDLEGESTDLFLGENAARPYAITFSTSGFNVGANTVLAQVQDNDGGLSAISSVQVLVNAAPTIDTFTAPDTSVTNGVPFTLAVGGVADSDGSVLSVDFYIDSNGDGAFTLGTDRALGKGRNLNGVWSLTTSVRNLTPGVVSVFARANDNNKGSSQIQEADILIA